MSDLFRAAESGNLRALRAHLRSGMDCNTQTRSTKATPLIWGSRKGHSSVVKILLKCEGIDPNIVDSSGNTALHYACRANDLTVASLLFAAGADLMIRNERNEYAMQLPLDTFNFFKSCTLDQYDMTIQNNIAAKSVAASKSVIARFEMNEMLENINRRRVEIKKMNTNSKRSAELETLMSLELPNVHQAGDDARVLQEIMFSRLGEVRAEHNIVLKKYQRMEKIALHFKSQINVLNEKSIKYNAASVAIREEIEELTAGLAAKTDTLSPLRTFPNNEQLQEICIQGLLSLIDADSTEAIHQGLSGENCSELMENTQKRFLKNQKIQSNGNRVREELNAYQKKMSMAKMVH